MKHSADVRKEICRAAPLRGHAPIIGAVIFTIFGCGVVLMVAGDPPKIWRNKFEMEFVQIPAGTFAMGAPDEERLRAFELVKDAKGISNLKRYDDEAPVHRVTITHDFYLGRCEVTQGQWTSIMHEPKSVAPGCGDDCPVQNVSWTEVSEFITRLNSKDPSQNYRLPTEAEWEYAARAGQGAMLQESGEKVGWFANNAGKEPKDFTAVWRNDPEQYGDAIVRNENRPHPVAQKAANPWGLYDMLGNVWEWVSDFYDPNYYAVSPQRDPQGPSAGKERVLRGGSFDHNTLYNAAVTRVKFAPDGHSPTFGFRLVATRKSDQS